MSGRIHMISCQLAIQAPSAAAGEMDVRFGRLGCRFSPANSWGKMNNSALIIGLRLIHVVAGAAWVGAFLALAMYVFPLQRRHGTEGTRIVQRIVSAGLFRWIAIV